MYKFIPRTFLTESACGFEYIYTYTYNENFSLFQILEKVVSGELISTVSRSFEEGDEFEERIDLSAVSAVTLCGRISFELPVLPALLGQSEIPRL